MPDNKKKSLKPKKTLVTAISKDIKDEVKILVELCKKQIPIPMLLQSCTQLTEERAHLHHTQEKISQLPFLAAFILWAKEIAVRDTDKIYAAKILLETGLIHIAAKNGKIWTIRDAVGLDH